MPLKLFGAGTDSGTFDYFTEAINGKAKASRSDYPASEDDNVLVQGVEGERGALGYFGFSYYEENKDKLKVLADRPGEGLGLRRAERHDGTGDKYKPLVAAALHLCEAQSFKRPVVAGFIGYIFNNERAIAKSRASSRSPTAS